MLSRMAHHARLHRALLLVAVLLAAPAVARAEAADQGDRPERPLYGLAMAGAYFAAPMLGLGLGELGTSLGIGAFLLTPPIAHLAYADPWWALASLFGPAASIVSTSLLMIPLSQCNLFGNGLGGGGGNCDGPAIFGAVIGYLAWAAFDVTMSSLRSRARLHDNSKRSPQPMHEPSTPAPSPTASFGQCILERRRG